MLSRSSLSAQQLSEFEEGAGVEDIRWRQAGTSSLQDAITHLVKAVGGVSVSADDDGNAETLSRGTVDIVEIQTVRAGVQFQEFAVLASSTEDRIQIDVIRLAAVDQPPGGVRDDRHMGVLNRLQQSLGDLLARLFLPVVNAGDDPLGLHILIEHILFL